MKKLLPLLLIIRLLTPCFAETQKILYIKKPLYESVIRSMVFDDRGDLWIGSFGAGVWTVTKNEVKPVYDKSGKMPEFRVSKLWPDGTKMWAATAGKGLLFFDREKQDWFPAVPPSPEATMRYLHALLFTSQKDIFLGSVGSGAARLSQGAWHPIFENEGLTDDWINDAVETPEGVWLAGSKGLALFQKDRITKKIRPKIVGFSPFHWGDPELNSLCASGATLFIGTISDGVFRISPEGKEKKIRETAGNVQAVKLWKNSLWACGPGKLWKSEDPFAEKPIASGVIGPWEKDCHFKSLAVSPSNTLYIGTFDGKIYETTDGASFSLILTFAEDRFKRP